MGLQTRRRVGPCVIVRIGRGAAKTKPSTANSGRAAACQVAVFKVAVSLIELRGAERLARCRWGGADIDLEADSQLRNISFTSWLREALTQNDLGSKQC